MTKTRLPFQKALTVSICSICPWYYHYWPFWMHNWRICRNVMFNLMYRKYYSRWVSVIWYYYYLKIDTDSTSNIQKKVFWVYSVHFVRPQKKQSSCKNHLKSMKVVVACGQAEGSLLTASCLLLGWQMEMSGGRVSWKGAHPAPRHPHQGWDHHINIVSSLGP